MKRLFYSVMAIALVMFVFSSCKKNVEKEIIGQWQVEKVQISGIEEMVQEMAKQMGVTDDQLASFTEEMKKDMEDSWNQEFTSAVFEFTEDHKVTFAGEDPADWTYDADNEKLVVTTPDGQKFDMVIDEIGGGNMKATMVIEQQSIKLEIAMEMKKK